jgi:uncharacterized membrane protein YgdD (TMEM256/DUF423 family)
VDGKLLLLAGREFGDTTMIIRLMGVLAGLLGAAGVGAAALAAHGGYSDSLRIASEFALIHGALAMALLIRNPTRMTAAAAGLVLLGALLFCGDLGMRALATRSLFPMAAPSGGLLMIAGWLAAGLATFLEVKRG